MKDLYVVLPGLVPGTSFLVGFNSMSTDLIEIQQDIEPWSVVTESNTGEYVKKLTPRVFYAKDKLFTVGGITYGKGQKILVPAYPGTGKSTLAKGLINIVKSTNNTIVVKPIMVDERPEENLGKNTLNLSFMKSNTDIFESMLVAIGKLMIESHRGHDTLLVIDSLSRLVEVANSVTLDKMPNASSGVGGISLPVRKFVRKILGLGANLGKGRTMTVVATSLLGKSPLDQKIYEDLKGVSDAEMAPERVKNKIIAGRGSYNRLDIK